MATLHEQHRPRTWQDVVGQSKALATIERLRSRGNLSGRAFWISGQSGTDKTTIARLIAAECAESYSSTEIDGGQVTVEPLGFRAFRTEARRRLLLAGFPLRDERPLITASVRQFVADHLAGAAAQEGGAQ